MNKFLTSLSIISLLVTVFISCNKEQIKVQPPVLPTEVSGKWIWFATYLNGPLSPNNPYTPNNTGNTEKLEYLNSTWKKIFNNGVTDSGTYNLEHGKYVNPSNAIFNYDQINYFKNGSVLDADWYEIHNDTLIITDKFVI